METHFLLFYLFGGVVSADTDAAGQFMISQPLVSCTLAGALLGNLLLGLTVGVLLQLPFLVEIPAGGTKVSLGNLGAFVAAGLAVQLNQIAPAQPNLVLVLTILYGLFLSWASIPCLKWMRQLNLSLLYRADKMAEAGNLGQITWLNYLGVFNAYVFGVVFSAIFLFLGNIFLTSVIQFIPLEVDSIFRLGKAVLLGAGVGTLLWLFMQKTKAKFVVLGVLVSVTVLIINSIK
jgi:fructoselysine and glucoselysine-specific PTS system IIC component